MKVLVTGGAGFIGSNLVDKLIDMGLEVIVIDNLKTGNYNFINPRAKFILEDITSDRLVGHFKMIQPQIVFHLAAQIDVQFSINNPIYDANVNILGTIKVLDACIKSGVEKIIYASSAASYGAPEYLGLDEKHNINPISFYGITKHTPEHYFKVYHQLYGLKFTVLRYANVFGIRQDPKGEGGVISVFIDKLLRGEVPVIYGTGEQTRDFIYVSDIISANVAAIYKGDNKILNIGTSEKTTVLHLYEMINELMEIYIKPVFKAAREGDIIHSYFNNSKARLVLKWEPEFTLKNGLKETIDYYSERKSKYKKQVI